MNPGDLVRSRSQWVSLWDDDDVDGIEIEIDAYPRKFELLLILGEGRNRYYHRVLTSGGIVGYVMGIEITPV